MNYYAGQEVKDSNPFAKHCRVVVPQAWDSASLKMIMDSFPSQEVLVVGDLGVDRYTVGSVDRISPEAPVPVIQVQREHLKLGLAANVAENVKTLEGKPLLSGVIGTDRGAEDFKGLLSESEIDSSFLVQDSSRRTALKDRIVSESQQLLRVDFETTEPVSRKIEEEFVGKVLDRLNAKTPLVVEDYAKGLLSASTLQSLIEGAKKVGATVVVDPNANSVLSAYQGASVFTPNRKEAETLCNKKIRSGEALLECGAQLLNETQSEWVVVTLGKDGMAVFGKESKTPQLITTCAREVFDVSGAGDTVVAVMSMALACKATITEAAILGNLAAGVVVSKRGTATVTRDEILSALEFFQ